jgi:hypothetical protein
VFFSTHFITFDEKPCCISFQFESVSYKFHLEFVDNYSKSQDTELSKISSSEVKCTFNNFNDPLGTFNIRPLKLGTFGGKEMYFRYTISKGSANTKHRNILLTMYLKKGG